MKDKRAGALPQGGRIWLWLSLGASTLAIIGNIIALSVQTIYSGLTPVFLPQALAQDYASLAVVSPLWIILTILALRGSARAYLMWLGVLIFTIYNYVIYTFSVPFGALFLLWVAVLGLCLYSLIGGLTAVDHGKFQSWLTGPRTATVTAWFLIVAGILFTLLWLSEDIPAVLSGVRPQSLIDMGVPTNPVHVLDLSFFVPAVILAGIMLLRKRPLAFTVAPSFIVFLILTGIPILITPVVQTSRGETAAWGASIPIGTLVIVLLGLLIWLMSKIHPVESKHPA